MIKSISIIFPFYNEQNRIKKTLIDIKRFNLSNKHIKKEFIFVNDGSSDKTIDILNNFRKNYNNIKIINYKINRGKGYALKRGVKLAKYDWILTTDSDLSVSSFQLFVAGVSLESVPIIISIQACSPSRRLFESRRRDCASGSFVIRDRLPMCRLTVAWPFSSVRKPWEQLFWLLLPWRQA